MESPYNRAVAINLIRQTMDEATEEHRQDLLSGDFRCGLSIEARIYDALKRAGFLTEEAMVRDAT